MGIGSAPSFSLFSLVESEAGDKRLTRIVAGVLGDLVLITLLFLILRIKQYLKIQRQGSRNYQQGGSALKADREPSTKLPVNEAATIEIEGNVRYEMLGSTT